jgi:hypothetical protein
MLLPLSLLVISGLGAPAARADASNARGLEVYRRLWSDADDARPSAVREVLEERRRVLFQCYQVLLESGAREDRIAREAAKAAAHILGEYRCVQAVPLLTDNLTLSVPPADVRARLGAAPARLLTAEGVFPCVAALIHIGLPALEPVVSRAEASDDELVHRLAAHILRRVLGPKMGDAYLEDRIEKQCDATSRERLLRLKARLQETRQEVP